MRVLIIVPEQDHATGNWVTAQRFASGLEAHEHQVALQATPLAPTDALTARLTSFRPDVALLLHAYRSGRPWLETATAQGIPYAVLLTGTDVNVGLNNLQQRQVIGNVLQQSRAILLQNRRLITAFNAVHPFLCNKVHYLSPSVTLGKASCDLRQQLGLRPEQILLLCPASVRPVKGVLELLLMCDRLAEITRTFHLAFCGPILDPEYGLRFCEAVSQRPWASYLGVIAPDAMAAGLRSADLVLNNSEYEGLSNALLEATTLGVPILARNIPGNVELVEPQVNGLLYTDTEDFLSAALALIGNRVLRKELTRPGQGLLVLGQESKQLHRLLRSIV